MFLDQIQEEKFIRLLSNDYRKIAHCWESNFQIVKQWKSKVANLLLVINSGDKPE